MMGVWDIRDGVGSSRDNPYLVVLYVDMLMDCRRLVLLWFHLDQCKCH